MSICYPVFKVYSDTYPCFFCLLVCLCLESLKHYFVMFITKSFYLYQFVHSHSSLVVNSFLSFSYIVISIFNFVYYMEIHTAYSIRICRFIHHCRHCLEDKIEISMQLLVIDNMTFFLICCFGLCFLCVLVCPNFLQPHSCSFYIT